MLRYHSKKIATPHKHKDGRIFAIMALFVGLGSSAFWIIFPLILNNLIHSEAKVGFYYSFMAVLGLIFCLLSTVIFQRYSKIPILKSTLFVLCLGMIGMTAAENIWHLGSLDIIRAICSLFIGISLSLFVKEFATNSNLGLEEG
ncbi:MAG TPA: hypothetical protein VIT68_00710, partial [Candidatus Gracilibacteria bacterium]